MELRVEQLAARCQVSVDTIRYYQARGLLPAPRREGRLAWYSSDHVERIGQIRSLQSRGLTLTAIRRVVDGELGRPDQDLAAAVAIAQQSAGDEVPLSLEELAQRTGVAAPLLRALEPAGIELGRRIEGERRYGAEDVDIVRTALQLLEHGLPLPELLALAREHHRATRTLADGAVRLFDQHIRQPLQRRAGDEERAAVELVEAFHSLLDTATSLVGHHFRQVVLRVAEERIEGAGAVASRETA